MVRCEKGEKMVNTVTISVEEYDELREIKKAADSGGVIRIERDYLRGFYSTYASGEVAESALVLNAQKAERERDELFAQITNPQKVSFSGRIRCLFTGCI